MTLGELPDASWRTIFSAWALGYMANPLALDDGELAPANLVLLMNVGDNVQYAQVFSLVSMLVLMPVARVWLWHRLAQVAQR